MRLLTGYAFTAMLLVTSSLAAPGDTLYAQKNNINVRGEPSIEADVVLQVQQGHRLIEFERSGEWIHVGVERTGGKSGWIHASLVGDANPGGSSVATADPSFDQFVDAVSSLNQKVKPIAGSPFFDKVENLGDGIVQLRATPVWLSGSSGDQRSNLNTLFALWDAAEGSGLPIQVRIVDQSGALIMQRSRP